MQGEAHSSGGGAHFLLLSLLKDHADREESAVHKC